MNENYGTPPGPPRPLPQRPGGPPSAKNPPPRQNEGGSEEGGRQPIEVRVVSLKPLPNGGNLKAFADLKLRIAGVVIRINGCRLIGQAGQRNWVSFPQREWVAKDGTKKYSPVVQAGREVTDYLLEPFEQALADNPNGFAEETK